MEGGREGRVWKTKTGEGEKEREKEDREGGREKEKETCDSLGARLPYSNTGLT